MKSIICVISTTLVAFQGLAPTLANEKDTETQLNCSGTLWLPTRETSWDFNSVILTVSKNVRIENLPMFTAEWPIKFVSDISLFMGAETTSGGEVQGNINRITGEIQILALDGKLGDTGVRVEAQFDGFCKKAKPIF